jgi:hypothetical protein
MFTPLGVAYIAGTLNKDSMPLLPLHKRIHSSFDSSNRRIRLGSRGICCSHLLGRGVCHRLRPLHRKLLMRMPNKPTLAALATLLISLVMVILPLSLIRPVAHQGDLGHL